MEFPAEMLVDYVRVYQRKGETNIGCSPPGYPTADYINNHSDAYSSALLVPPPSLSLLTESPQIPISRRGIIQNRRTDS